MTQQQLPLIFNSDNYSSVHPKVLSALVENASSIPFAASYGNLTEDSTTAYTTTEIFQKQIFPNSSAQVFYVFNGTAANALSVAAACKSYNSVLCKDVAHIYTDECGAVEKLTNGVRLTVFPNINGKLTVDALENGFAWSNSLSDNVHTNQPKLISISQLTEYGTVYSVNEIKELADWAHQRGMYLHMDGARLANAAISLNLPFKEFTVDAGVDILSFGGTKNGMMYGEAVVIFNKDLLPGFQYIQKQSMQLASKTRFISAQFKAMFDDEGNSGNEMAVWKECAKQANEMAQILSKKLKESGVSIAYPTDGNEIFCYLSRKQIDYLYQNNAHFYIWKESKDGSKDLVRFVTSFSTTIDQVDRFADLIQKCLTGCDL